MATDTVQNESAPATPWGKVFAKFSAINAAYDEAIERHSRAEEAADDECPREARFFDVLGLGMGMSRKGAIDALRWYGDRTGEEINERAVADEFMAYQARSQEAAQRNGVKDLDRRIEELEEPWWTARDELMAIPAPDVPALMVKLEQAFTSLSFEHSESAMADAKRLLGGSEHG